MKKIQDTGKSEQFRLECESRYWVKWAMKNGPAAWRELKYRLSRMRGQESVSKLVKEMERQRLNNTI